MELTAWQEHAFFCPGQPEVKDPPSEMASTAALGAGIMVHESTWSMVACLKKYLVRVVTELADHVAVGGTAWNSAIVGMREWDADTILGHLDLSSHTLYRTTASHYVVSTLPESVRNGRTRIPSRGVFARAFVRSTEDDTTCFILRNQCTNYLSDVPVLSYPRSSPQALCNHRTYTEWEWGVSGDSTRRARFVEGIGDGTMGLKGH